MDFFQSCCSSQVSEQPINALNTISLLNILFFFLGSKTPYGFLTFPFFLVPHKKLLLNKKK